MEFLVKAVKKVFPQFEFMWLAEEMQKNLPLELSFVQEAKNAEKVSRMLREFSWLKVSRGYSKKYFRAVFFLYSFHRSPFLTLKQKIFHFLRFHVMKKKMLCPFYLRFLR